mmetsp:Transcript_15614/g.33842  ORF Transcript_15614/g.33842 Transcript_15614/m.33842 type:complete len:255 (+) Transcript_15614:164-928(+)
MNAVSMNVIQRLRHLLLVHIWVFRSSISASTACDDLSTPLIFANLRRLLEVLRSYLITFPRCEVTKDSKNWLCEKAQSHLHSLVDSGLAVHICSFPQNAGSWTVKSDIADGEGDGSGGGPKGHHVTEVLILEGEQWAFVDGCPHVPPHIVRRLKRHLGSGWQAVALGVHPVRSVAQRENAAMAAHAHEGVDHRLSRRGERQPVCSDCGRGGGHHRLLARGPQHEVCLHGAAVLDLYRQRRCGGGGAALLPRLHL